MAGERKPNIFGALLTGAALGAAAMALSNPETRKKVRRKLSELKEEGQEAYHDVRSRLERVKEKAKNETQEAL